MIEMVPLAFRFFVGFIFILASIPKLAAPADFERAIHGYALVPPAFAEPLSAWVPRVELGAGIALVIGVAIRYVAVLLALALVVFTLAVALNLMRGREIDCGCFGGGAPRKITWLTAARNSMLAAMAATVAIEASLAAPLAVLARTTQSEAIPASHALATMIAATVSVPALLLVVELVRFRRLAAAMAELAEQRP